jgi:hypothetical protein
MSIAENTKISLAYPTYRYNPEAYRLVITSEINNQAAILQILDLKALYKELAADLVFFIKKVASYYDGYRNIEPMLKEKDKVYLI